MWKWPILTFATLKQPPFTSNLIQITKTFWPEYFCLKIKYLKCLGNIWLIRSSNCCFSLECLRCLFAAVKCLWLGFRKFILTGETIFSVDWGKFSPFHLESSNEANQRKTDPKEKKVSKKHKTRNIKTSSFTDDEFKWNTEN